ncbi:MAG: HEPN domain-containing protein, partial [Nitrososphaerales archaeon]|nr:HEPN domain-containing protein [Nitrososphaerales archaeon]
LKAATLHILGFYPRGHDLVMLYRNIKDGSGISLEEHLLSKLSAYYTIARYPNAGMERPSEEITREQAMESLSTAKGVLDAVRKIVQDP